jgi:hypothetical protein
MNNANYKSLGSIMWRVLKNPLASELTYEEAAEYALEFIKLLGAPVAYENKLVVLDLTTYKAELPCDLLYLNGVRYLTGPDNNLRSIAMREASDVFHLDPIQFNDVDTTTTTTSITSNSEFTYKIQKGIIFTSMCDGCIQLSYQGIATDEDGYPLIPDNEKVMIGMEYYILNRYLEPLWMMGKITDKAFDYIQQKRYFYLPSAFTALQMPGVDKMETLMNGINRLIINTSAHQNGFKKFGEKEIIKQHR